MIVFWLFVLAVALVLKGKRRRKVKMLYRYGRLENDLVLFPCGCRFRWSNPDEEPTICEAHKAIIAAEVKA